MDKAWYNETKHLSLKEQWNKLFDSKMKLRQNSDTIWGKSKSSAIKNAEILIKEMPAIIKRYNINKFVDIENGQFMGIWKINEI